MLPSLHAPRRKIVRALDQTDALQHEFEDWARGNHYQFIPAEYDARRRRYRLRVAEGAANRAIPHTWAAAIGEVAHDLRSALDQLLAELARLDHGSPPTGRAPAAFPIHRFGPRSRRRDGQAFRYDAQELHPLCDEHRRRVEAAQPYKRAQRAQGAPLWTLREIQEADQQARLRVVAGRPLAVGVGGGAPDTPARPPAHLDLTQPLAEGVPVGWAEASWIRDLKLDCFAFYPTVAFWEGCPSVRGHAVAPVLRRIANTVCTIVEDFASDFEPDGLGASAGEETPRAVQECAPARPADAMA